MATNLTYLTKGKVKNSGVTINTSTNAISTPGTFAVTDATDSTTATTGSVKLSGGMGIVKSLFTGGTQNQLGAPQTSTTGFVGVSGYVAANSTGNGDGQIGTGLNANTYQGGGFSPTRVTGVTGGFIGVQARTGNTSPSIYFQVNLTADGATATPTTIGTITANGAWAIGATSGTQVHAVNGGLTQTKQHLIDGSADEIQLRVQANATQTANLITLEDSSANLIGTFSAATSNLSFIRAANPGAVNLQRANTSLSSPSIIASGDILGAFRTQGHDGTTFQPATEIRGVVDTTPGSGSMPGRIAFFTTPSGSVTISERARIDSAGQFNIITATDSTTTTSGSFITAGGAGIAKALFVGGSTNQLGAPTTSGAGYTAFSGGLFTNNTGTSDVDRAITMGANVGNNGPTRSTGITGGMYTIEGRTANSNGTHVWYVNLAADSAGTSPTVCGTIDGNGRWVLGKSSGLQAHAINGASLSMTALTGSAFYSVESSDTSGVGVYSRWKRNQTGSTREWWAGTGIIASGDDTFTIWDNTSSKVGFQISGGGAAVGIVPQGIQLAATGTGVTTLNYYEEGSYNATVVGFAATVPTVTIKYRRIGKIVTMLVPVITGTSNSTSFTLSLATQVQPGSTGSDQQFVIRQTTDNGAVTRPSMVFIASGGTVLDLRSALSGNTWTATGTKGCESFNITYMIA